MEGAEGRGGGQQHVGVQQAYDGQQAQRQLHAAGALVLEGGAVGGDEGAYAHHLGTEVLYELQVLHQGVDGLPRRADHESRADLEAQVTQVVEALHAVVEAHLRGVEEGVVCGVGGLVAQQVAVGAGVAQAAEAVAAALAQREGDGAVGVLALDVLDEAAEHLVGEPGVLAALQHEGAEAQAAADGAALEDLLGGEPVAIDAGRAAYAAVEAVVAAVVADFDQSAHEDIASVDLVAHARGFGHEVVDGHGVAGGQQVADAI